MIINRFTVIIDACVLHCVLRRNLILSLAEAGMFRPRWTPKILDEFEDSLTHRPNLNVDAKKQRQAIEKSFPEGCVEIDENLLQAFNLTLPDANDLHVLLAAIHVRAPLIVTENLKDFPKDILKKFDTEAVSADTFIADAISLNEIHSISSIKKMRERFNNPRATPETLIQVCEARYLSETANLLSEYKELL